MSLQVRIRMTRSPESDATGVQLRKADLCGFDWPRAKRRSAGRAVDLLGGGATFSRAGLAGSRTALRSASRATSPATICGVNGNLG